MAAKYQVMTIAPCYIDDYQYVVIHDTATTCNPYTLYRKWYCNGWHKRKVASYQDFDSVLFHLLQLKYKKVQWDLT